MNETTTDVELESVHQAMLRMYVVLRAHVGQERMGKIIDELLDKGVVFRMADWWIAEQQPPAPTAGATGGECQKP